jgi:LytR cell envelope-related transcriptional attenuator
VSHPPAGPSATGRAPAATSGRGGPAHSPRSGAHRPRRPLWHDLLPALVVLVAVAALVLGIFELKDSVLGSSSTSTSGPSVPGDGDNQPAAPTAPTSSATSTPSATATNTATHPPAATVDHAVKVHVWNATDRTGLAKGAATKLSGQDWTADSAGNKSGYTSGTAVYYAKASLKATAKAVAKDLGGYPARLSSSYGSGVVVILGSDYQP